MADLDFSSHSNSVDSLSSIYLSPLYHPSRPYPPLSFFFVFSLSLYLFLEDASGYGGTANEHLRCSRTFFSSSRSLSILDLNRRHLRFPIPPAFHIYMAVGGKVSTLCESPARRLTGSRSSSDLIKTRCPCMIGRQS